jgi:hypothetical protein
MVSYFLIMQTIILVVVLGGLYFLFPRLWDTWYVPLAIGGGVFILASVAWFNLSWLNGTKRRGGGAYMKLNRYEGDMTPDEIRDFVSQNNIDTRRYAKNYYTEVFDRRGNTR